MPSRHCRTWGRRSRTLGNLIYSMITSLDGFVSDPKGNFEWGAPDEETHEFINQQAKSIGTYLFGRRMYDMMVYWETAHLEPDEPPAILEYARSWQAANKFVYSTTLNEVATRRTRIERTFDPEAVRKLKAGSELDLSVSGPHLAAQAIRAGLVDEYKRYIAPVTVGGGNPFFPSDLRLDLELRDEHRCGNGVVFLHYGVK